MEVSGCRCAATGARAKHTLTHWCPTKQKKAEAENQVLDWNAAHPAGSPVAYDSKIRRLGRFLGRTRCAAVVLPGFVAGVWITGHSCAVALCRLMPADESEVAAAELLPSSAPDLNVWAGLFIRRLDNDLARLAVPDRQLTLKLICEQLSARLLNVPADLTSVNSLVPADLTSYNQNPEAA